MSFTTLLGLGGVGAYVVAYGLLQLEKLDGNGITYSFLNVVAASLVLISLMKDFNLASAIIQITWIAIGAFGIGLRLLRTRNAAPIEPAGAQLGQSLRVDASTVHRRDGRRRTLRDRLVGSKKLAVGLGVSISDGGVVATLVQGPNTVLGVYRASPPMLGFLGLRRVLQDAATHLQCGEETPICLVSSPQLAERVSGQLSCEQLNSLRASRLELVRAADLPPAELRAGSKVGRVLDSGTDVVALAAASYALNELAGASESLTRCS